MDKIKLFLAALLAIVTGAFLFERSRRKTNEAIADNKEVLDEIAEGDKQKATNDGQLESERIKRDEIAKEADDAKRDDSGDVAEFLRKR